MAAAFTPQDPGNPPATWRAARWWPMMPTIALPPTATRIVVVAAHPDDETLGVGGLIHAAARAGHRIDVVVASDGGASHPESTTVTHADLVPRRAAEVRSAVALLAPSARLTLLDLPDGTLTDHEYELADAITGLLGEDTDCWLLSTWLDDGHPDHAACARAARRVASRRLRTRAYEYPVWYWHAGTPMDQPPAAAVRFDLDPADRCVRAEALARFASQVEPLSPRPGDEAVLPAQVLAHFDRDCDVLFDVTERPANSQLWFDEQYRSDPDPWDLAAGSWYEDRRRSLIIASLPRRRFRRCFEPGAAGGQLSVLLAERVEQLVSAESAGPAYRALRRRLDSRSGVEVLDSHIPDDWPAGRFDLVVLSEVGYYLPDLHALAERLRTALDPDGVVVLAHWRRVARDHPHTAETVHATLRRELGLTVLVEHVEADFLLDVLARDSRSVAERTGVVPASVDESRR